MPIFTSTQVLLFCLPSLFQCKCVDVSIEGDFPLYWKTWLKHRKRLKQFHLSTISINNYKRTISQNDVIETTGTTLNNEISCLNKHLALFGAHVCSTVGDVIHLICHMTSNYHLNKRLCKFTGENCLWFVITLISFVTIGIMVVEL